MKEGISIIGNGSFGTVIANLIATNGYNVSLWCNDTKVAIEINQARKNTKYQPNLTIHQNIKATSELSECLKNKIVFFAVPSRYSAGVVDKMKEFITEENIIISVVKGFLDSDDFFFTHFLEKNLGIPEEKILVLSGPNLSKEIAEHKFTATTIAGKNNDYVSKIKNILENEWFLVETSQDVLGVQLGGGLKNIYAIASGIIHSRDYGNNCLSYLLTKSIAEMISLAKAIGANANTILGISGIGDLMTTCTSELSRNYRLGVMLGKGFNYEQSKNLLAGEAEGYKTTEMVYKKMKSLGLDLPILSSIYHILYQGSDAHILLKAFK